MAMRRLLAVALVMAAVGIQAALGAGLPAAGEVSAADVDRIEGAKPRNVVFILTDDHRYDAMGFMNHPWLETPAMDRLAREGVHLKNAYVTTALCSPSRASILTGQYAHTHQVVDNSHVEPAGTIFFPQYLQAVGYETGFFGKWHMGADSDMPRPGFDKWVSFRGQGFYYPGKGVMLNIDGKQQPQKGYITDELTDLAVEWLEGRSDENPFFMYLSHKGVHGQFEPAKRHEGKYAGKPAPRPATMVRQDGGEGNWPIWSRNQRYSYHGVDFMFQGSVPGVGTRAEDVDGFYQRYCETLLGVDESIARVLETLEKKGILDSTLVIYMGDNGFMFGEHGLVDKRCAYEASMRVPMVMRCPELFKSGTVVEQVVANIDIAPTVLAAAGVKAPARMQGASFIEVAQGKDVPWRDALLYEYYWERAFPHTPTQHAIRTDEFKYIRYHGLWDAVELNDIID